MVDSSAITKQKTQGIRPEGNGLGGTGNQARRFQAEQDRYPMQHT